MALPTTVVSGIGRAGHSPPFKSSAGDFYVLVIASGAQTMDIYKATDPTDSWAIQDAAGNPVIAPFIVSTVQDGDLIHIAQHTSATTSYHQFNMATDAWTVIDQVIDSLTDNPAQAWISIAVRSDGDVVVVYNGDTDKSMGATKERVDVNVRTSGTWGGPVALDAGGDIHYGNPNAILSPQGNDDIHILWSQTTDNTADPPTAWENVQARTIRSDDVLSTTITGTSDTGGALLGIQNGVVYDNAGAPDRIEVQFISIDGGATRGQRTMLIVEDLITGDLVGGIGSDFQTHTAEQRLENGEIGVITMAALANNGSSDLHVLYSGGGTDGVDQDLYYSTSTDEAASWSTPNEEIDGITVNHISANIYVRDGATVLAYLYDDGDVQKYNEKVLIAGGAGRIMSSLVRSGGLVGSGGIAGSGGGLAG